MCCRFFLPGQPFRIWPGADPPPFAYLKRRYALWGLSKAGVFSGCVFYALWALWSCAGYKHLVFLGVCPRAGPQNTMATMYSVLNCVLSIYIYRLNDVKVEISFVLGNTSQSGHQLAMAMPNRGASMPRIQRPRTAAPRIS